MADDGERIEARLVGRIAEIPTAEWDACAGTDNPFVTHGFLTALEDSGSVGGDSGWIPRHLMIEGGTGQIKAAAPAKAWEPRFGATSGPWTTNDFVEAVYKSLMNEKQQPPARRCGWQ